MVTGASTVELAVILIDARKGVLTQTRRHSYVALTSLKVGLELTYADFLENSSELRM